MSKIISPVAQFSNAIRTERPDVVRCTVKRLATIDGLGTTQALRIGDTMLVKPKSARLLKIINSNGREFTAAVVDTVSENGQYTGWVFVDLFTL